MKLYDPLFLLKWYAEGYQLEEESNSGSAMRLKNKNTNRPVVALVFFDDRGSAFALRELVVIIGIAETVASGHSVDMSSELEGNTM